MRGINLKHTKKDWRMTKMLPEQLDDAKRQYTLRKLDEKIFKKECKVNLVGDIEVSAAHHTDEGAKREANTI